MSKIYTNSIIHTEDPKNPQVDTVVIDDGKFSYVGKAEECTMARLCSIPILTWFRRL